MKKYQIAIIVTALTVLSYLGIDNVKEADVNLDYFGQIAFASAENPHRTCPSATFSCSSGGQGSSSCSVTVDTVAGGVTYSVTCQSGCYACCNGFNGAKCFKP